MQILRCAQDVAWPLPLVAEPLAHAAKTAQPHPSHLRRVAIESHTDRVWCRSSACRSFAALRMSPGRSRSWLNPSLTPPKRLNLTHPTCAEWRLNLIRTEFGAGVQHADPSLRSGCRLAAPARG